MTRQEHKTEGKCWCKACHRAYSKAWHAANKERHAEAMRRWYGSLTPEQRQSRYEYRKQWGKTAKGAEYDKKRSRKWYVNNKERAKANSRKWIEENRGRFSAATYRHRAQKLNAIPKWANHFVISEIYDLAKRRTKVFGIKMEVDHIVPLQSPLVCGLHVEHNLRIIPKAENSAKRNRWWPDMTA